MSRSEHGNARDKHDPKDVARKARIKRLIVSERQPIDPSLPTVTSHAIPVDILDHGQYVHYPASIEDLRGVMARLPADSLNGLGSITLCVTGPDHAAEPDATFDPFVGRLRDQIVSGVYGPSTLGEYQSDGARIRLFAYVYDPTIAERPILETYLRLQMLSTFVHELGHHQDYSSRMTRGRWRADRAVEREARAELIEEDWVRAHVLPYLEDEYPAQIAELRRWLAHHGGVVLPLEMLVQREEAVLLDVPFEGLLGDVMRGNPALDTKVDFAFNLHYGYHFDLALAVLDHVLEHEPGHVDALRWRAHVLGHLDRHAEADAIARGLLERDPTHRPSLYVLRESAVRDEAWTTVYAMADRLLALETTARARCGNLYARSWAGIELAQWSDVERDLDELRTLAASDARYAIDEFRARVPGLCERLRAAGRSAWADQLQSAFEAERTPSG